MTGFVFRGKPVISGFGIICCVIFVIAATMVSFAVQPFFWLVGLRGPVFRNDRGGIHVESEGSFQRRKA